MRCRCVFPPRRLRRRASSRGMVGCLSLRDVLMPRYPDICGWSRRTEADRRKPQKKAGHRRFPFSRSSRSGAPCADLPHGAPREQVVCVRCVVVWMGQVLPNALGAPGPRTLPIPSRGPPCGRLLEAGPAPGEKSPFSVGAATGEQDHIRGPGPGPCASEMPRDPRIAGRRPRAPPVAGGDADAAADSDRDPGCRGVPRPVLRGSPLSGGTGG